MTALPPMLRRRPSTPVGQAHTAMERLLRAVAAGRWAKTTEPGEVG